MHADHGLVWPGKALAAAQALAPPAGPWRLVSPPGRVGQHAFYEGDNLAALQHLRGQGPVHVIYIDPPYNTRQAKRYADVFDHAAWLDLMYPRLLAAHALLAPEGVLFASIDDHETHRLRLLLDEVFGERNFVGTVIWRKKVVRGRGARHLLPQTEYVHVYAKSIAALPPFAEPLTDAMRAEYTLADEDGPFKLIPLAKSGTAHSPRPNLVYDIVAPDGTAIACPTHQWRWSKETLAARGDEIEYKRNRKGAWVVYTKQRLHLPGGERARTPVTYYDRVTTTDGTAELKALIGRPVLDFPKPSRLIADLVGWATTRPPGVPGPEGPITVLDFFAGSCPTARAVLDLNAADGGDRRFICVQTPTPLDDPDWPTIAAVGQARIARALSDHGLPPEACAHWRWDG